MSMIWIGTAAVASRALGVCSGGGPAAPPHRAGFPAALTARLVS
jgi:hypothetical protein